MDLFDEQDITHQEKWLAFHRANPSVYESLVGLARKLRGRGHKHYGMKSLFEVVRFHRAMDTQDSPFKLNNNYTAFYARLLMLRCSDLDGFFEVRIQKSANKVARDAQAAPDTDWRNDPFWLQLCESTPKKN